MARRSSQAKRLQKLAAEIPDDQTIIGILQALEPEQNAFADHSIAMIGASIVDKALEVAIRSRFIPMKPDDAKSLFNFESFGPLSDLSARIKIARAMDIVGPKTHNDLEHIRVIRNSFAHSLNDLRFDMPEVAEVCDLLYTPGTVTILGSVANSGTARGKYIEATVTLGQRLKRAIEAAQTQIYQTSKGPLKVRLLP